ncbi:coatomer WD associated region-domain-containing protein, partial [Endogone sp. FLAS-F59071]
PSDGGTYELFSLPKDFSGEPREPTGDGKRGSGTSAIFIARNRFAVLDKTHQQIQIRDLTNTVTKSFKPPSQVNEIFYAGAGNLLLSTSTSVILYDITQRRNVTELSTPPVKYVVWSPDMSLVALLSKHTITLANKNLEQSALIHETIRIKSGAWDDAGIFVYCTLNHIKYALPQGDNGIIRTLDQPVYLTRVKGKGVHVLDRDGKARTINIDPTEYRFKLALVKRNYDEVLQIIRNSNLVGQSIIAYLQKKGYPEVALQFVRDDKTRFELALECGNIEVALETAKAMNKEECWNKLGAEALRQGNHKVVEMAYQLFSNFDRLSFLYLATGNVDKLKKMMKIAELRNDTMSRFHNSLYLGDVEERIRLLKEVGQLPLAYLTAKSHGLTEEAEAILTAANLTVDDIEVPPAGQLLQPPPPIVRLQDSNWPLLTVSRGFFDSAFAADQSNPMAPAPFNFAANGGDIMEEAGGDWGEDDFGIPSVSEPKATATEEDGAAGEDEEGGWDLDADIKLNLEVEVGDAATDGETAEFTPPAAGTNESAVWVQNSPLAADHIAAGSFETAMQILNRQVGIVNFTPLKPHFLTIFQASRVSLPANISLPPLSFQVRRNGEDSDPRRSLPVVVYGFQDIISNDLQAAYKLTTSGKFANATTSFKAILHSVLLTVVSKKSEVDEVQQLIGVCREYILGLSIEQSRRTVSAENPDNIKRALELSAYFTHCQLQPAHLQLALRQGMKLSFKVKNFSTASMFARRLLELAPPQAVANEFAVRMTANPDCSMPAKSNKLRSGHRAMNSNSITTHTIPSSFAVPRTHPFTRAAQQSTAHTARRHISPSTRAPDARSARSHRLAPMRRGCG